MSSLTYVEKEKIATFFGFKGGYVFTFIKEGYTKTNTRDMIYEATGIDIYNDQRFAISQERCIRKIWDECDDYTVGKLLKIMLDYYLSIMRGEWNRRDEIVFQELRGVEEKLMTTRISIPEATTRTLNMIKEDIERNCNNNTPELALDRLHTFSIVFFRSVCESHGISTKAENGRESPLQSLVGKLKAWYEETNYFDSEFAVVAIRNTINTFDKFNQVRNNQSTAHPNEVLNKAEATYVVHIVVETLTFIANIERIKNEDYEISCQSCDDSDEDMELPF